MEDNNNALHNPDDNIGITPEPSTEGSYRYSGLNSASSEAETKVDTTFFRKMALPCLIFAVLFVAFMYHNSSSYTMTLWIASLAALVVYSVKATGRELKKDSRFVIGVMLLIAASTFFTGNEAILFLNWVAEFILVLVLLLHNYADDTDWDFGKYFFESVAAIFLSIGRIFRPFTDLAAFCKENKKGEDKKGKYVLIGIAIALPLLFILGLLLSSADMVFSDIMGNFLEIITLPENFFGVLVMLVFGFFAAFCGLCYMSEDAKSLTFTKKRNGEPTVAITIMAAISVMYLMFSVIQILYLFVGGFELPDGVTYAEYARTGFFQLLAVCVLNLIAVLLMKKYFRENKALNILLLVVSGCTYIMIASSAMRMIMYIQAYHLTFMRVFVLVALFTLAVLLAGVIVSIFKEGFCFFRYGVAVISIVYILFAFSHSEYFIAKYNFAQRDSAMLEVSKNKNIDVRYISELSTDAAPAIADFFEDNGIAKAAWKAYPWYCRYINLNDSFIENGTTFRKFNLSAYIADGVSR